MRKISLCFLTVLFSFPLVIMAEQSFFIKNEGQLINEQGKKIEEVLFVYKGKEYDVYFQNDKISYILKKVENPPRRKTGLSYLESDYTIQSYRVDLEFLYSEKPKIEFEKSLKITQRHLNKTIGEVTIDDAYQEVLYRDIYNGIDLKFYIQNDNLKYDFIVHPNANYKDIKLKYVGAKNVNKELSKIIIETPLGNLEETIPETYQEKGNKKRLIKGDYLLKDDVISFQIENYDPKKKLTIDPWATFIGGVDIEEAYSTCIDNQNNTYIAGYTGSTNFPITVGVLQTIKQGQYDAFLTKLDNTGNVLWSTFYGGAGDEYGYKVLLDSSNNPLLIGHTNGNDLLVSSSGVFQTTSNGSYDSFILKLDSSGGFVWGTYFGGTGGDLALTADLDNNENLIIGGYTSSIDIPLVNPFQNTMAGALDAFVAKFTSTGNLMWSTYCGGTNSEDVHALHVDNQNNIIITGETYSNDFPVSSGAYQVNNNGNLDIFLTKYDALGSRVFSTYFGGFNREDASGLTSDNLNNIYMVGYSESNDFPMIGSGIYQSVKDFDKDAFIAKFTPLGQPLKSTFIGGSAEDRFTSAEISSSNLLHIAGYTSSVDAPIIGAAYQLINNGFTDGFYYKLDTALQPLYSTYLGGSSADYIYDLKIDSNQLLTFAGFTSSGDFPVTANVFQDTIGGQSDAFVIQVDSVFSFITNLPRSFKLEDDVEVYPNPFSNQMQLQIDQFNKSSHYEVLIYSVEGKKVLSQKISQQHSHLKIGKTLIAGNYFFVLLKDKQVVNSTKLIKK